MIKQYYKYDLYCGYVHIQKLYHYNRKYFTYHSVTNYGSNNEWNNEYYDFKGNNRLNNDKQKNVDQILSVHILVWKCTHQRHRISQKNWVNLKKINLPICSWKWFQQLIEQ